MSSSKGFLSTVLLNHGTADDPKTATSTDGIPVLNAAGTAIIGTLLGGPTGTTASGLVTGSTTTRVSDTNAYASGDQIGASVTAGSVVVGTFTLAAGVYDILGMKLVKSQTSLTNASFRVHLYTTLPVVSGGDNAAWSTTLVGSYAGAFDITCDRAFGDGAFGAGLSLTQTPLRLTSGTTLWYLLEARAAYSPASAETFIPYLVI